jgi:hypothetical protein
MLLWLAWFAPCAGAWLGGCGVDPLRFGPVAPAMWAVAVALLGAAETQASLPTPAWGALAWTALFYAGMAVGALCRSSAASAAAIGLTAALLVGLPSRAGIAGEPWPAPAASALLDLSPFVFLGECSGVRDMAWHRSLYASVGTDRFQRAPWDGPWAAGGLLALTFCCAWIADRRRRAAGAGSRSARED